jgi:serine protease AprX
MKKKVMLGLLIVFAECAYSQLAPGMYLIWLKDKAHSSCSLSQPELFLSERAIQRRARQGIPLDYTDLPVSRYYTDSLQKLGLQIHTTSRWFNTVVVTTYDTLLLDTLSHISFIQSIETGAMHLKSIHTYSLPDKFLPEGEMPLQYSDNTGIYGQSYGQIAMLNGDALHNLGLRGQGMVIALLDAGFYKMNETATFDSHK